MARHHHLGNARCIHRSSNLFFQIGAVLLNIFLPVLGLLIYLIVRPEQTLVEKYHEDLFTAEAIFCPNCHLTCPPDLDFCPHCGEKLSKHCRFCHRTFSRDYPFCPHCGRGQAEKTEFVPKQVASKMSH